MTLPNTVPLIALDRLDDSVASVQDPDAGYPSYSEQLEIVQNSLLTEIEIGVVLGALDVAMDNIPAYSAAAGMVQDLITKFEKMSAL